MIDFIRTYPILVAYAFAMTVIAVSAVLQMAAHYSRMTVYRARANELDQKLGKLSAEFSKTQHMLQLFRSAAVRVLAAHRDDSSLPVVATRSLELCELAQRYCDESDANGAVMRMADDGFFSLWQNYCNLKERVSDLEDVAQRCSVAEAALRRVRVLVEHELRLDLVPGIIAEAIGPDPSPVFERKRSDDSEGGAA